MLTLVHVLMAVHIILWLRTGLTVSPVEPSESAETLTTGAVNAGFVFFTLAILSTIVFGRFFCGWGCHVVAFQDLCTWMMNRIGVRPRQFRSRLLLLVPLGLAIYMFVWPVIHRAVLPRLFGDDRGRLPAWMGEVIDIPGISTEFIVQDFWATFAPWYIAIPFLLVCTFGAVYFLGSKGFCTYGCPYGGFFAPADKFSVGRIKVTDACNGCGHCTAVCGSNVRVHEEVRDFGMVMDPGCMKHMDCVSVCPNDALYFGFDKPSIITGSRPAARLSAEEAKAARAQAKVARAGRFDLSWPEEVVVLLLFLLLFWCYRGMLTSVPMLMAVAMGGIAAFSCWKTWSLLRPSRRGVRLQSLQLKRDGRITPLGWVFAACTIAAVAVAAWSGHAKSHLWRARMQFSQMSVPFGVVLRPEYAPSQAERARAVRSITHFARADSPFRPARDVPETGPVRGWGWALTSDDELNLAYLYAAVGEWEPAERLLRNVVETGRPADSLVFQLAQMMRRRDGAEGEKLARAGASPDALRRHQSATEQRVSDMMRAALERRPKLHGIRAVIASELAARGERAQALAHWTAPPKGAEHDPEWDLAAAGFFAGESSRPEASEADRAAARARAIGHVDSSLGKHGANRGFRLRAAGLFAQLGERQRALEQVDLAITEAERRINGAPGSLLVQAAGSLSMLGATERAPEVALRGVEKDAEKRYGPSTAASAGELLLRLSVPAGPGMAEQPELRSKAKNLLQGAKEAFADDPWTLSQIGRGMFEAGAALGDSELLDAGLRAAKDAAEHYAAKEGSESPSLRYDLANQLGALGRLDEAAAELTKAAEAGKASPLLAEVLSGLLGHLGRADESRRWAEEAVRRAGGR